MLTYQILSSSISYPGSDVSGLRAGSPGWAFGHPWMVAVTCGLFLTWVGSMSREWLALVEMGKENEKFSPSLLFLHQASASRRNNLHPLSIVLCIVAASAFVALLFSKAAAVAPVSSLFLKYTRL